MDPRAMEAFQPWSVLANRRGRRRRHQGCDLRRRLACWPGLAKAFRISRSFWTNLIRARFARAAAGMSCREASPRSTCRSNL